EFISPCRNSQLSACYRALRRSTTLDHRKSSAIGFRQRLFSDSRSLNPGSGRAARFPRALLGGLFWLRAVGALRSDRCSSPLFRRSQGAELFLRLAAAISGTQTPMKFPRSSGILLHPTSLSGPHGIGDLGTEAYRFVDF